MQKLASLTLACLVALAVVAWGQSKTKGESFAMHVFAMCDEMEQAEWWHRVPGSMSPTLYPIDEVVMGQNFSIAAFFTGFGTDADGKADVTYTLEQVTPNGEPNELGSWAGVDAKITNTAWIQLATAIPRVSITSVWGLGKNRFIVTATDHIGGTTLTKEVAVDVLPWNPEETTPLESVDPKWMSDFYQDPRPDKAYMLFRDQHALENQSAEPSAIDWIGLNFFRYALAESDLALDTLIQDIADADEEVCKKTALLFLLLGDEARFEALKADNAEVAKWASAQPRPDPYAQFEYPIQLDMLWAEFLATGRYKPLRQILDALELVRYSGSLDAYASSDKTAKDRESAVLEAIFQAARWSLASNATQHDRVLQYLTWASQNEELGKDAAAVLAELLNELNE